MKVNKIKMKAKALKVGVKVFMGVYEVTFFNL